MATPQRQRRAVVTPSIAADSLAHQRPALLKKELDTIGIRRVRHVISGTMSEKRMLTQLQESARLVDDIYGLQVHGSNLIWRQQIQKSGSDVEKLFYSRFGQPWCRDVTHSSCNALASLPRFRTGTVFWPRDIEDSERGRIGRMINARELLSPFSLVVRDGMSRYRAVSYPEDVRFSELFKSLSESFNDASDSAPSGLRQQLSTLSEITKVGNIDHFGLNDQVVQGGEGEWRIIFDGFSTKLDPFGTKRAFELIVGRVSGESQEVFKQFLYRYSDIQQAYQGVTSELAALSSVPDFDTWTAVDEWLVAGRMRRAFLDAEYNGGVDTRRRLLKLQQYAAARKRYGSLFGDADNQSAIDMVTWTKAFCVLLTASYLVPASILESDVFKTFLLSSHIDSARTKVIFQAMRDVATLWIIGILEQTNILSEAELKSIVTAVLSEILYTLGTTADGNDTNSAWVLEQLATQQAVVLDSKNTSIQVNAPAVISVGMALFETLNHAIVDQKRRDVQRLFPAFAIESETVGKKIDDTSELNVILADVGAQTPTVYEFRLEFQ